MLFLARLGDFCGNWSDSVFGLGVLHDGCSLRNIEGLHHAAGEVAVVAVVLRVGLEDLPILVEVIPQGAVLD